MEEMVLGALLLDNRSYDECSHLLSQQLFTSKQHALMFAAISDMKAKSIDVDIMSLVNYLRNNGLIEEAGGPKAVVALTKSVNSSAHVRTHIKILQNMAVMRELQVFGKKMLEEITLEDVARHREEMNSKIDEIINRFGISEIKKSADVVDRVITDLNDMSPIKTRPFGLSAVDRHTGGMRGGDLIIIAARPGMGKTAMALKAAKANAEVHTPVLFISQEMSAESLVKRLASAEARVRGDIIRDKKYSQVEFSRLYSSLGKLHGEPFYIYDKPLRLIDIQPFIKSAVKKHGIGLVVIDYMQLIDDSGSNAGNREQFIASVSRTLKICGMQHDIPVIALSQLSRKCEERGDKRPMLADLRESGAIEQDADMVIFLYRDEQYGIMQNANGESTVGKAEFIISKFRNGSVGNTQIGFDAPYTHFYDLSETPHAVADYDKGLSLDADGFKKWLEEDQEIPF